MHKEVKKTLKENYQNYIELLDNPVIEKSIIKELNDNVDIPIINEKTEKKILKMLYKSILNGLSKIDVEELLNKLDDN